MTRGSLIARRAGYCSGTLRLAALAATAAALVAASSVPARATDIIISTSTPPGSPFGTVDYFGAPTVITSQSQTYTYYPTPTLGEVFTAPVSGPLMSFTLYLYGSPGSVEGAVSAWTPSTAGTVDTDGGTYGGTTGAPLYESSPVVSSPTAATGPYFSGPLSDAPLTAYTFNTHIPLVAGHTYIAYLTVIDGSSSSVQSGATGFVQLAQGDAPAYAPVPATPAGADYAAWNNFYYCAGTCTSPGVANPDVDPNNNGLWLQPQSEINADFVAVELPEPAAWGLLLAGFSLTGWALRTTRRALLRA